jgi:hypothetical protein
LNDNSRKTSFCKEHCQCLNGPHGGLKALLTDTSKHRLHHTTQRARHHGLHPASGRSGTGSKNGLDEWLADPADLLAVLRIVGDEVQAHGLCALHIDAIAARAGVGRLSAQNALREARDLGLVTVKEPVGEAWRSKLVRVVSQEWRNMVALAARFKKEHQVN